MFYQENVIKIRMVNSFASSAFTQVGFMSEHSVDSISDFFNRTARHVCALGSIFDGRMQDQLDNVVYLLISQSFPLCGIINHVSF